MAANIVLNNKAKAVVLEILGVEWSPEVENLNLCIVGGTTKLKNYQDELVKLEIGKEGSVGAALVKEVDGEYRTLSDRDIEALRKKAEEYQRRPQKRYESEMSKVKSLEEKKAELLSEINLKRKFRDKEEYNWQEHVKYWENRSEEVKEYFDNLPWIARLFLKLGGLK
jgi:hypothetical protein